MHKRSRASFLRTAGGAVAGLTIAGAGTAEEAIAAPATTHPKTPAQALERLMAGNAKFVKGKLTATRAIVERRMDVAGHQMPFAILVTCADSRVPPEHVFNATLGELFVCRVAGNILNPQIIGSIEYAVDHFHSLLVMALGHQRCGAVTDTIKLVENGGKAPGQIETIVEAIAPVVRATRRGSDTDAVYVDRVVKANARAVAHSIPLRSPIVSRAVSSKKLRVVAAEYSLDSGRVTVLS